MNLNPKLNVMEGKPPSMEPLRTEQPINLAQKTLVTNINPVVNQTLQLPSTHAVSIHGPNVIDASKLNLTTLRMPLGQRLTVGGSVPILPTSGSTQILTSKSIVRPSNEQSHATMAVLNHGSTTGSRQVMTTVLPVMSLSGTVGNTTVPMASIIRGSHPLPQNIASHPTGTVYSSHVPRGPAAVASISAGPKSVVATPVLRPAGVTTVPRNATLVNRTTASPLSKTSPGNVTQVIDIPRLANPGSGHTSVQLGFPAGRVFDTTTVRTAIASGGKPIHISQPIVHQVQQIGDKSFYKAAGATILTASQTHLIPQTAMAGNTTGGSLTPIALSTTGNQPSRTIPSTCVMTIAPGSTMRTSVAQQLIPATATVMGSHQTLTVVSGKSIGHVVTSGGQHGTIAVSPGHHLKVTEIAGIKKIVTPSTNPSVTGSIGQPRVVQTATPSVGGIPVAKVYPQPLTSPRSHSESGPPESPRGNIFIAHAPQNISASNPAGMPTTVVLSENINEGGPIRFASIPRPQPSSGTPYTVQPTAYYYESYQVQNTIAMHPYSATAVSSNQSFTTTTVPTANLRPATMPSYIAPQPTQVMHTNHNTSPRPSILRKRTLDGPAASVKKNLTNMPGAEPTTTAPSILSNVASTSTITSRIPSTPPRATQAELKENGNSMAPETPEKSTPIKIDNSEPRSRKSLHLTNTNGTPSQNVEASPRKKPRKQQLAANELLESNSNDEDYFQRKIREIERKERELQMQKALAEEESAKWVTFCKRPSMSLLQSYRHTWKSRHNHFLKYTDVKPKDEKKQSVNELANQKNVLSKINGWKVYHLTTQMEEAVDLEDNVYTQMSRLLNFIESSSLFKKTMSMEEDRVLGKVTDLIKGNLQRSKIVQDQVCEVKQQIVKVLDHKPHVRDIIGKYVSKRPIKKKTA